MSENTANRLMLRKLLVMAGVMFAFGFALVPFYKRICQVTGVYAAQQEFSGNTQVDSSRWITVQFLATVNEKMPWAFEPVQKSVRIHPGELTQIAYKVHNLTSHQIIGQAVPAYGPAQAALYFKKVQCFCFTQQTLNPGESRVMPVLFLVEPKLPKDVHTITLSYTFFEVKDNGAKPGAQAANENAGQTPG